MGSKSDLELTFLKDGIEFEEELNGMSYYGLRTRFLLYGHNFLLILT